MKRFRGSISGNIFKDGKMRRGTIRFHGHPEFSDSEGKDSDFRGTLIPGFINAHTHIGDSFINEIPAGDIPSIVGPGGFKQRMLATADEASVIAGMKWAMKTMASTGTYAFMDFRESGKRGIELLRKAAAGYPSPVILGRPVRGLLDLDDILIESEGIAPSAISDVGPDEIEAMSREAHAAGKIFGIHFSENVRENLDDLLRLKPDFVVHTIEATDDDLEILRTRNIPVAITPRSNIFYGKRPDYSRYVRAGLNLMIGTDNGMISSPDMFSEISFLYLYQRGINPVAPEAILSAATENPHNFLAAHGVSLTKHYIFYPEAFLTPYEIVTRGRYYRHRIIF